MNDKDKEELYQKLQDCESDWIKMRDIAEKMQAENKKLREALTMIKDYGYATCNGDGEQIYNIAAKVLGLDYRCNCSHIWRY
jgi:hypothetical protein